LYCITKHKAACISSTYYCRRAFQTHQLTLLHDALTLLALHCCYYYYYVPAGSKLFTLELVGHDEYTRKLLDDRAIFPQSYAQLAAARLAETLSSAKLAVRGVLRAAALAAEATANSSTNSSSVYANGGFAGDAAASVSQQTASSSSSSDGRGRLTAAAFAKAVERLESAAAAAAPSASTGM
jgi:hypothetical protein